MLKTPSVGQVIRYSYLWREEYLAGRDEGSKDRPCVIVVAVYDAGPGLTAITVVPVTHAPPSDPSIAIEIPRITKLRLGLDDLPSWIILSEANQFRWPGQDIRPIYGKGGSAVYGGLPYQFITHVRTSFIACMRMNRSTIIPRTE